MRCSQKGLFSLVAGTIGVVLGSVSLWLGVNPFEGSVVNPVVDVVPYLHLLLFLAALPGWIVILIVHPHGMVFFLLVFMAGQTSVYALFGVFAYHWWKKRTREKEQKDTVSDSPGSEF